MYALKAKDLVKEYSDFRAIDSVSFNIKEGECFGILGVNGAGKSTLINIISGLLSPTSGKLEFFGLDSQKHWFELKKITGHCFGFSNYMDNMTGRENLTPVGFAHGLTKEEINSRVDKLAELLGLEKIDEECAKYSSGMLQKLSLIAALIHNPKILLVDELTVGLDVNSAKQVRAMLKSLKGEKTIVLTTHYMAEAEELCDRIALIHKGKIVAVKPPEELKRMARSYDLLELVTSNDKKAARLLSGKYELEDGMKCRVTGKQAHEVLELLLAEGIKIKRISLREPSLEEVFEGLGEKQ